MLLDPPACLSVTWLVTEEELAQVNTHLQHWWPLRTTRPCLFQHITPLTPFSRTHPTHSQPMIRPQSRVARSHHGASHSVTLPHFTLTLPLTGRSSSGALHRASRSCFPCTLLSHSPCTLFSHFLSQGAVPVELSIERLLRRSTGDTLLKLLPSLITTAQRYSSKCSAPNLTTVWKPSSMAAAAAAAATAAEVAAAGSNGGSNAALVNTRLIKLMGSLKSWWPAAAAAGGAGEQCQQVGIVPSVLAGVCGWGGGCWWVPIQQAVAQ